MVSLLIRLVLSRNIARLDDANVHAPDDQLPYYTRTSNDAEKCMPLRI